MVKPSNRQVRFSGETVNVSSSGVLFEADATVEEGEPIEYYITLPTSPSPIERLRLHCVGKVMRIAPLEGDGPPARYSIAATMERYEFTRQRMAAGSPLSR
jgi:hypothetical protein